MVSNQKREELEKEKKDREMREQLENDMKKRYEEFQKKMSGENEKKNDFRKNVELENLTLESLRNICLKTNISTKGLTTKQDFVNMINQNLY